MNTEMIDMLIQLAQVNKETITKCINNENYDEEYFKLNRIFSSIKSVRKLECN